MTEREGVSAYAGKKAKEDRAGRIEHLPSINSRNARPTRKAARGPYTSRAEAKTDEMWAVGWKSGTALGVLEEWLKK